MLDIKEATKGLSDKEIRNYVNQTTMEFFTRRTTMAKHTDRQSMLDEALGEFKDYGFRLEELDDHTLELYFKDKRLAVYNQTRVTPEIIREGCKNFMVNILNQDYLATYGEELKSNG